MSGAATYLLWFRAAGVQAQIFDTNDLSTIRGSSLALRHAPDFVETELKRHPGITPDKIFSGASQAPFRLHRAKHPLPPAPLPPLRSRPTRPTDMTSNSRLTRAAKSPYLSRPRSVHEDPMVAMRAKPSMPDSLRRRAGARKTRKGSDSSTIYTT